jgi:DNA-binding XRE family transcriptional regulator
MSFTLKKGSAPTGPRNRLKNLDHPPSQFARWRAIMGLTQGAAAAKFGVTRATVVNWETRKTKPKAVVRIAMMAMALPGVEGEWPE